MYFFESNVTLISFYKKCSTVYGTRDACKKIKLFFSLALTEDAVFKEKIPLPEDVELKDLQSLKAVQEKMHWNWQKIISLNLEQEVSLRNISTWKT